MPKLQHHGFWYAGGDIPDGADITPIRYRSEFIVATYSFIDGLDLDTRTKLQTPNVGDYLGWARAAYVAGPLGTTLIRWGGDNTGTGVESVCIDIDQFKANYPELTEITVDFRCFWYRTIGVSPVNLSVRLYRGGTILQSGYGFTNPTASESILVTSTAKTITLITQQSTTLGAPLARLNYNLYSGVGYLDSSF